MRPQAVSGKQCQLFEVQIYSTGNYLFNLQNRQKTHFKIILWNKVYDVTRGDEMTRGRDDQGTK
jgi:hypothetical protein